jgi:N-methylhydantoinase A/oxoprolinase/acetone carboxylase beta subunit
MRIGIDAGGTFTDFVILHDDGRVETFKLRSDPKRPAAVILAGIERAAKGRRAEIVHGSTVATNALLERKGARTAFVTTEGFEDLISIGRQNRAELYNLTPTPKVPLVDPARCFGVRERTLFDGSILRAPSRPDIRNLRETLHRVRAEAVAICFLHTYQNGANEAEVASALPDSIYVSTSHTVAPEFREYERASTTVLNAYVGSLMDRYLSELERGTRNPVSVLQSNGGFMTAAEARQHAVRTILSGPAGGVVGALETARQAGYSRVLGFDMGGTSTDVSLCDGAPRETVEASVDGFPVRVPMLDIQTVGAGGGSIARVDEGGLLRVGPESAGADPGPACYGTGDLPTVTDAHVVLGRIAADQLLGGAMHLDITRSAAALDRLAQGLGTGRLAAAEGVVRVANANMERAIRSVSVERGYDPAEFALVAFGGCGGLHACEIAAELGIKTVLAPLHAGALSAMGMLQADRTRDYAAGALNRTDWGKRFRGLERTARKDMRGATLSRLADVRYVGQSYEITVPWNAKDPGAPFHAAHQRTYGFSDPSRAIEIVTVRVRAKIETQKPRMRDSDLVKSLSGQTGEARRRIRFSGRWRTVPVCGRAGFGSKPRRGPLLIADYGSTTLVPDGWRVSRSSGLALLIER